MHREEDLAGIAGFENGRGHELKECRQPLGAGKLRKVDSPLEPPEGTLPYKHLGFCPVRSVSNFRADL